MREVAFSISLMLALTAGSSGVPAQTQVRGRTLLADGSVRIHGVVLGPISSGAPDREPMALLESAATGETVIVRSISRRTGLRLGDDLVITFPESRLVNPVRAIFSRILAPGSLVVLDTSLRLHVFPIDFISDGTPIISGGPGAVRVLGPFGEPVLVGEGSAIAEEPAAGAAMLAIGTRIGQIIAVLIGARDIETSAPLAVSSAPIDRLVAFPQVGYLAFGAATAGRLIGINPDSDSTVPGLQPAISFELASPGKFLGITDIGAPALDHSSHALSRPARVPLLAANGTSDVALVGIPSNPAFGEELILDGFKRLGTDIARIAVGSFAALSADGTGVLFQTGPFSTGLEGGRTVTVAGATVEFEPGTLNLRSNGRVIETTIEVENRGAATINPASLMLQVDGVPGGLPIAAGSRPRLDQDEDEDGNVRLRVQFDRKQLAGLVRDVTGPTATLIVTWLGDGSVRAITTASTEINVIR